MSNERPYAQSASGDRVDRAKDNHGVLPMPVPFGKYYLLEKIATGGMAEVFKAKAFGVEGFERLLAVKRILSTISEDTEFISMFIDEAKIAGRLNHANIAQIFDLGKADASYFIAMEYVSGQDARAIFERYRNEHMKLGIDMACYIVMKVCEGLDYAHNKTDSLGNPLSIVHRDVSPQNVLVSYEGEVKIIDFGIAKAAGKSTQTQVGILKGKFSYMSPEQVRGLTLDRRSDIFSLSIVLYELLTLERLFLGESDFETLEKIRKVEVAPPSLYNPHIPKQLEDIVLKGLAKDPNMRFQTTHEMQEALQKFMFNQSFYFTNKDLAATLQDVFAHELLIERQKLEYYQTLDLQTIRRQSGETDGPAVQRGTGSSLDWDDDEIPTTVYDRAGEEDELAAVLADFDQETHDLWSDPISSEVPPPPVPHIPPTIDDASVSVDLESGEDAWDRIAAEVIETGPVASAPLPRPERRPSGLYAPVRRRSNRGLFAILLGLALVVGATGAYLLIPWGPNIELVFTPEPSTVTILLDDQIIHAGNTPFVYRDATPGNYSLTLMAEGFEPMTREVSLADGGRYNINWPLEPVETQLTLSVASTPAGAAIWVDGRDTRLMTPATLNEIDPGDHGVRLVRHGYLPLEEQVTVLDAPVTLNRDMIVERFRLVIRPQPPNARYSLTERNTGIEIRSGTGPADLDGLVGQESYLLMVEAPGRRRYVELLEPSGEAVRLKEITLEPMEGAEQSMQLPERVPLGPDSAEQREGTQERRERERRVQREPDRTLPSETRESQEVTQPTVVPFVDERQREDEAQPRTPPEREQVAEAEQRERERPSERDEEPERGTDEQAQGPGFLTIQSRPSAQVFVDGSAIGYTPVRRHELPAGRHTVRLVNERFGLDFERTVTVSAGEEEEVIHRQD